MGQALCSRCDVSQGVPEVVERQFVCVSGPFRRRKYVERLSQLEGRPEKGVLSQL